MSDNIINVTDSDFEQTVLGSATPVLVDFWAEWCGPCKMIAPILEDIASEYAGRLVVAKLNVDDNQITPSKYGVRGIPTLILFQDGKIKTTKVGALSKSQLGKLLEEHL